jgi:thioredoxin-related protein
MKQLILITAPFKCGFCEDAKKDLPKLCEKYGFELIELEDDPKDALGADSYPTIMLRVNEKMVKSIMGYNKKTLLNEIKKY